LGLALDELDESDDFKTKDNDIDIVYDDRLKNYIETGAQVIVDFRVSPYGSGFVIDGGSTC